GLAANKASLGPGIPERTRRDRQGKRIAGRRRLFLPEPELHERPGQQHRDDEQAGEPHEQTEPAQMAGARRVWTHVTRRIAHCCLSSEKPSPRGTARVQWQQSENPCRSLSAKGVS